MRRLIVFCFIVLITSSCGRRNDPNETKLNLEHLDKEISDRVLVLNKDTSFSEELEDIRKNVENLKYLTIDIENINASLIRSNEYFKTAAKLYGVDTSGFVTLYKGDPLQDVENIIKKNQLNLLNKIIIQRNKSGNLMYTAQ